MRPVSAGFAVPVFAFFSAGVTVGGYRGLVDALGDPITVSVVFGLVVGKAAGVLGTAALIAAVTRASSTPASAGSMCSESHCSPVLASPSPS